MERMRRKGTRVFPPFIAMFGYHTEVIKGGGIYYIVVVAGKVRMRRVFIERRVVGDVASRGFMKRDVCMGTIRVRTRRGDGADSCERDLHATTQRFNLMGNC